MKKKLLMLACCGPCFTYIEHDLRENGLRLEDGTYMDVDYTACFYNPNIHPKVEYERRKNAFIEFCKLKEVKNVVIDEYELNDFVKVKGSLHEILPSTNFYQFNYLEYAKRKRQYYCLLIYLFII